MSRPAVAHLLFGLVCSLAISCSDVDQGASDAAAEAAAMAAKRKAEADRAARIDSITRRFSPIGLRRDVIRSASHLDSIRHAYAPTGDTYLAYRAFATVNRKDIQFFRIGDTVMIPDTIMSDRRAYSVFPQYYEHGDTIPKIVFVSNKWQAYACYEYGELVRFAAVNSGEERKPTFPGRYAVNWKARLRLSSLDSTWRLPYTVNFHQYAGLAFHQFEMPGRPVSHSCVRQFLPDAEWLFKWVRQAKFDSTRRPIPFTGTPVVVLDVFDYSRRRGGPWWDITSTRDVVLALPKEPLELEEALVPMSQIPKDVRGALPNRRRYVAADSILRERGVIRQDVSLRESINFNKLRRERKARAAAAEEARKREEEAKAKRATTTVGGSE